MGKPEVIAATQEGTTKVTVLRLDLEVDYQVSTDTIGLKRVQLDRVRVPDGCGDNILPLLAAAVQSEIIQQVRDQLKMRRDGYDGMLQRAADTACAMGGMNPSSGVRA